MSRLGWYESDGIVAFAMPDQVFGEAKTKIIYQNAGTSNPYRVKGTVAEWSEQVGRLCVGNSRLTLAASAAFAAPLLYITGDEGGGIYIQGGSRDGKTTTQYVGGSVGGSRDMVVMWRATANGLEAVCEERCDGLLCLDEMGQLDDAKQAGEIAYMVANGKGKSRMMNSTGLRRTKEWRVLFLSSGEISLSDKMAEAGKKARAGQQIRLLDVPSDAGAGYGVFETIHGWELPKAFADHLRNVTMEFHGAPATGLPRSDHPSLCG